jgi:uncharacterized cupredoxin-like copper-binding protein
MRALDSRLRGNGKTRTPSTLPRSLKENDMKKAHALLLAGIMAWMGAALPAWAGKPRQIAITLEDTLRIRPDHIAAKAGETVDFVVHNAGKLRHEFVIGDATEVEEHARKMRETGGMSMDDMAMGETQVNDMSASGAMRGNEKKLEQVDVMPGKTVHLLYRFKKPGELAYACLYPGHREGGMKGIVTVK